MMRSWEPTDISPLQTEHATRHRIPLISTRYSDWFYIVGIIVGDVTIGGEMPTEEEVEVIARVRNVYLDRTLPRLKRSRAAMQEFAPYDIDGGGVVCLHFLKRGVDDWACQRSSNSLQPTIFPNAWEAVMTLEALLAFERLSC